MKFSELKGKPVVDLADAKKMGEVEDLLVDPESHRILTLKVKTGLFSAAQLVPAGYIKSVGSDAVTISASDSSDPGPAGSGRPTQPIEMTSIMGNKVVTDAGTVVGDVRDVLFEWVSLMITGYEVREGGLFSKPHEFAATPDVRYGDKIITIPAELLNHPV
ncbi:MAG: PRC-barrel domain-containing protein [Chloroflexota bacterium]|nr:PRC-barrel domain-containing protein [Chloroflexota bacterium]